MSHSLHWTVLLLDEHVLCEKNTSMLFIRKIYISCENINWCSINVVFLHMGRRKFEVDYTRELFLLEYGTPLFISYTIGEIDHFVFFRGFWRNVSLYRQIALIQLMRLKRGVKLFTLWNWPRKPSEGDN